MTELVTLTAQQPVINLNFNEAKARLEQELSRYNVVVTADTVADAKKMATELNARAKSIDDLRKARIAEISAPIKSADGQMKELVQMCRDGRSLITDQVKRFEDQTRATAQELLAAERTRQWDNKSVESEFRRAEFDDLIMLTAVTKTGKLASRARSELDQRTSDDARAQARVRMRLLELENNSFRAGLSAPLERQHVDHFLHAVDDVYARKLQALLDTEVERQRAAEKAMRERIEREAEAKRQAEAVETERRERQRKAAETASEQAQTPPTPGPAQAMADDAAAPAPTPTPTPAPTRQVDEDIDAPAGETRRWTVTATFEVDVPEHLTQFKVGSALANRLRAAGFTSVKRVRAELVEPETA